MYEPARGLTRNDQALAIDPDAHALAALDAEIVARERAAGLVTPPFHRNAFGPFDMRDCVTHAPPGKLHRRAVGDFGEGFDGFGTREETDRAGGREGVQLCVLQRKTASCATPERLNHMRTHRHRGI